MKSSFCSKKLKMSKTLKLTTFSDQESTSVYREMRSTGGSSSSSSHMSRSAQAGSPDLTFGSAFSSMEYNIRVGSGLATVQSAREPVSFCFCLCCCWLRYSSCCCCCCCCCCLYSICYFHY